MHDDDDDDDKLGQSAMIWSGLAYQYNPTRHEPPPSILMRVWIFYLTLQRNILFPESILSKKIQTTLIINLNPTVPNSRLFFIFYKYIQSRVIKCSIKLSYQLIWAWVVWCLMSEETAMSTMLRYKHWHRYYREHSLTSEGEISLYG